MNSVFIWGINQPKCCYTKINNLKNGKNLCNNIQVMSTSDQAITYYHQKYVGGLAVNFQPPLR